MCVYLSSRRVHTRLKDCAKGNRYILYIQLKHKNSVTQRLIENGKIRRKPANNNNNKFVCIQVDVLLVIDCYLRIYFILGIYHIMQ